MQKNGFIIKIRYFLNQQQTHRTDYAIQIRPSKFAVSLWDWPSLVTLLLISQFHSCLLGLHNFFVYWCTNTWTGSFCWTNMHSKYPLFMFFLSHFLRNIYSYWNIHWSGYFLGVATAFEMQEASLLQLKRREGHQVEYWIEDKVPLSL